MARTFIQPGQDLRKHGLRMKFNPLREVVEGKRLVVVDDSIVRGNTTRQIVSMLRDAGAAEVHMRISAPPIRHPCHYGIDMSTSEEMVAHGRTVEEVAEELGCDSLAYLSLEGVYEAIRGTRETHCDACFSGDYPSNTMVNQGASRAPTHRFRSWPSLAVASVKLVTIQAIDTAATPPRARRSAPAPIKLLAERGTDHRPERHPLAFTVEGGPSPPGPRCSPTTRSAARSPTSSSPRPPPPAPVTADDVSAS